MKFLVVIDYQKDFVDGALGFAGAERLDAGIAEKILAYGKGRVFFTRDTHGADYLQSREGRHLPVPHCMQGSDGWQVYGRTREALESVQAKGVDKASFGVDFSDPAVCAVFPPQAEEIELAGLVSNMCVLSNAVVFQSRYPNAQIVVDAALTASFDPKLHEAALDILQAIHVNILHR